MGHLVEVQWIDLLLLVLSILSDISQKMFFPQCTAVWEGLLIVMPTTGNDRQMMVDDLTLQLQVCPL